MRSDPADRTAAVHRAAPSSDVTGAARARNADPRRDPRPYNPDGRPFFRNFDPAALPSPCFFVDLAAVEHNLGILRDVADRSGARVLLALKAFALPATFGLVRTYLDGVCASGVYEARLGREAVAGDATGFAVHTFAPAYSEVDFTHVLDFSDHIVFNTLDQWLRHRAVARNLPSDGSARSYGIRINPECSVGETALYDPSAPYSRLGSTEDELRAQLRRAAMHSEPSAAPTDGTYYHRSLFKKGAPLEGITGVHMHVLCESDSHALERVLAAVEKRFGWLLRQPEIRMFNMGGGHLITKPDYDREHLVELIRNVRRNYGVEVVIEPGEAVAIHTGVLVASVLDVLHNGMDIAILDTSATAHMPDTLEMPYRPTVWGAGAPGERAYTYRVGGQTCLAGDVMGDYSFDAPLAVGDRIVFDDMSHYTMVKTTTFNGVALPSIATWNSVSQTHSVERTPDYHDFRERLG